MRILVIGEGTIGSEVARILAKENDVAVASRTGRLKIDIGNPSSIEAALASLGPMDAVISCAASAALISLADAALGEMERVVANKLFGQIELTRQAMRVLAENGAIVLTSGVIPADLQGRSAGALTNAALEAFVAAAAEEMPRGIRLNVVSPGWVAETLTSLGLPADAGTPVLKVAESYVGAVYGNFRGRRLVPGI